jgi:aminobenzoyl-glutamate utilization protein B
MNTTIAHKAMVFASKVLATSAMDLMANPENLREAKEEFKEATKDFVYECFVPIDVKPPDAGLFKIEYAKIPD